MTDQASFLAASFRLLPEDACSTTVTAGWGDGLPREREQSRAIHDGALDDAPGRRPGKMAMSRQGASDIAVRAALSQPDRWRILTLPYPVEYQVFWQLLAGLGVTKERLMDRLGASL